jgi:Ni/Co efflux regulator RcnB
MNVKMLAAAALAAAALGTAGVGTAAAEPQSLKGILHIGGIDRDRDHDRYDHDHDRFRFSHFDYGHYVDYDDYSCYYVRKSWHIVKVCPDIY